MVAILVRVLIYIVSYMYSSCVLFPFRGGGGGTMKLTLHGNCKFVCLFHVHVPIEVKLHESVMFSCTISIYSSLLKSHGCE